MAKCTYCGKEFEKMTNRTRCSDKCSLLDQFKEEDGCWKWTGCNRGNGYGVLRYKGKTESAHRVSYKIFKGEIPEGYVVMHSCDCKLCINPDHLFIGTSKQNSEDMVKKNRQTKQIGEGNSRSVITEKIVLEMRKLRSEGIKIKEIAKQFNVKYFTCLDAVNGRNWQHI